MKDTKYCLTKQGSNTTNAHNNGRGAKIKNESTTTEPPSQIGLPSGVCCYQFSYGDSIACVFVCFTLVLLSSI